LGGYTVARTNAAAHGEHRGAPLCDFFRHGELRHGGRPIRRNRPPLSGKPKTVITLRLDEDGVSAYCETGKGWQRRINADLRRARKLSVTTATAPRNAKRAPVATRSKTNRAKK
jgi:BrnA antitoxin of type II toxin-antitoxin system